MVTHLFASNICVACEHLRVRDNYKLVLRTSTEDICATCGATIQTFPAIAGIAKQDGLVLIPDEVAALLVPMLKQGLVIANELPQIVRVDPILHERTYRTLAHRVGSQCELRLWAQGNSFVVIRWNYAQRSLLPRHPWEELHWNGTQHVTRPELQPDISKVGFAFTPSMRRCARILSKLALTEVLRRPPHMHRRALRFEGRFDVEQPLPTSQDVVLVIKAELGWLQVGKSFPATSGPREFAIDEHHFLPVVSPIPATLEEAVDLAVASALERRGTQFVRPWKDRLRSVVKVEYPLADNTRQWDYSAHEKRVFTHHSTLNVRGAEDQGMWGWIRNDDDALTGPALNKGYVFEFWLPERADKKLPEATIVIRRDGAPIVETKVGGANHTGGFSQSCRRIGYTIALDSLGLDSPCEITSAVTDENGNMEARTWRLIDKSEYDRLWFEHVEEECEQYKRARLTESSSGHLLAKGDLVAALIGGRWLECTYQGRTTAGFQVELVSSPSPELWEVCQLMPLKQALEAKLDVGVGGFPPTAVGYSARKL